MKKILYHTNFLELKSTHTENGDKWYYAHRPNAKDVVVILPVTEKEILFLIEKRPPMLAENKGTLTIGVAAGLVGDIRKNETIEDAIKTELLEETGLIAKKIEIKSYKNASSAGCLSETFVIAFAYIEDKKEFKKPIDDNGIIQERIWVEKKDVFKWLHDKEKKGYILTAQMLAALFYLYE